MPRPLRRPILRVAGVLAVLRPGQPTALAGGVARPLTHRLTAIILVITIPRIRDEELLGASALAVAVGVHDAPASGLQTPPTNPPLPTARSGLG